MNEVPAHRVIDFDHCEKLGDYFLTPPNEHESGARRLSFLCPCGCGALCGIRVNDAGTTDNYCWNWDLNEDKPTCTPSISINNGHWHGFLTDGIFRSC